MKPPKFLDAALDAVLAHKPQPRTRKAKKRAQRAKRIQRKSSG